MLVGILEHLFDPEVLEGMGKQNLRLPEQILNVIFQPKTQNGLITKKVRQKKLTIDGLDLGI